MTLPGPVEILNAIKDMHNGHAKWQQCPHCHVSHPCATYAYADGILAARFDDVVSPYVESEPVADDGTPLLTSVELDNDELTQIRYDLQLGILDSRRHAIRARVKGNITDADAFHNEADARTAILRKLVGITHLTSPPF